MKDVIKAIILPVVLGVLGAYFTYTYNEARIKADYAETIHKYLPEINSEDMVAQQMALEILRPILTSSQEKAISMVILVRQKRMIDQASVSEDSTFVRISEIAKLNRGDGAELAKYADASILRKEAIEKLVDGQYEEAAEMLKRSSDVHSDFTKSALYARMIEDSLVNRPVEEDRVTKVLDEIVSQRLDIPALEKRKID